MKYTIVTCEGVSFESMSRRLSADVNELLSKGWSLHGTLQIVAHSTASILYLAQPMFLKESEDA